MGTSFRWLLVIFTCGIAISSITCAITNPCKLAGQVRIASGNKSTCLYFVHLKQDIETSLSKEQILIELKRIYSQVTKKVVDISITHPETIVGNVHHIEYNIYTYDPRISAMGFQNYYLQSKDLNDATIFNDSNPFPDSDKCKKQVIDGMEFPDSNPKHLVKSTSNCSGNTDLPEATVRCRNREHFAGKTSAYFDTLTFYKTDCTVNIENIEEKIPKQEKLTSETATSAVNMLTITLPKSTDSGNDTSRQMEKANNEKTANLFSQIATGVLENDVQISPGTLEASVDLATTLFQNGQIVESTDVDSKPLGIKVVASLETMATHVDLSNVSSVEITTDTINLNVTNVANATEDIKYTGSVNDNAASIVHLSVSATVPVSALDKLSKENNTHGMKSVFIYYADSSLFPQPPGENYRVNQVLTASIGDHQIELGDKDNDSFYHQMTHPEVTITQGEIDEKGVLYLYKCVYLDIVTNDWSTKGCSVVEGSNPIKCKCNHMSSFAVIVQTMKTYEPFILRDFSKFCIALSVAGLSGMIAIHWYFPKLRGNVVNQIHINLGISLLLGYVVLLVGVERTELTKSEIEEDEDQAIQHSVNRCFAAAAILHFFLLSSWGWMTVEMYTMYRKFVKLFGSLGKHFVAKCAGIVYSCSVSVAFITFCVCHLHFDKRNKYKQRATNKKDKALAEGMDSTYISEKMCWLHSNALYYTFLAPVFLMFLINLIGFVIVFKTITFRKKIRSNQNKTVDIKDHLFRILMLSMLLGISWVFTIPLTIPTLDGPTVYIFSWLFSIINALQGFVIFLLFCVKRDEVRKLWMKQTIDTVTLGYFSDKLKPKPKVSETSSSLAMVSRSSNATTATNVGYAATPPTKHRKQGRLGDLQQDSPKQQRSQSVV